MNRLGIGAAVVLAGALSGVTVLHADVRTEQKTRFQLGGVLGRMVNIFGGRAAREGVTTTISLKGNRRIATSGDTSQIVDLTEEKVYDLDNRGKKYKVTTFAEMRRQMEEAQARAAEEAKRSQPQQEKPAEPQSQDKPEQELEFDLEVKNTGETKKINGFDTKQSLIIVTVREKGKTLEQSGGLVITADTWLGPRIPAMNELAEFELRYAQKVYGAMVAGASPRDMGTVMAMYPQIKPGLERMAAEGKKLEGTAILTTITADAVKSAEQVAQEAKSGSSSNEPTPSTIGGLLGGLARRGAQRSQESNNSQASNRATFLTTTHELLKVGTDVSADAVAIPANFKLDR